MTGYEGSHQDWLEGQASDQLEREAHAKRRVIDGPCYQLIRDGTHWTVETEWLSEGEMVLLAHAILAEVEIAQKGADDE